MTVLEYSQLISMFLGGAAACAFVVGARWLS